MERAKEWDATPERVNHIIGVLAGTGPLESAPRARFDFAMDCLYGHGFRDPELPEVGADYLAHLDEHRRALGVEDPAFAEILATHGGAETLDRLDGAGFVRVIDHVLRAFGGRWITLPPRRFMERPWIEILNEAVYRLNLSFAQHTTVLATVGGGCLRTRDLDARGANRVLMHYMANGYVPPEPAPRVGERPGFITQAQANVIWKLWHDYRSNKDDLSEAALGAWLYEMAGVEGGLHGLTAAGTRRVLDVMLAPLIALRLTAVAAYEADAGSSSAAGSPLKAH